MFKTWLCVVCGLIYDEARGWPDDGIVAGTRWEDVPADWKCPECKVGKEDFEMLDISPVVAAAAAPLSRRKKPAGGSAPHQAAGSAPRSQKLVRVDLASL